MRIGDTVAIMKHSWGGNVPKFKPMVCQIIDEKLNVSSSGYSKRILGVKYDGSLVVIFEYHGEPIYSCLNYLEYWP